MDKFRQYVEGHQEKGLIESRRINMEFKFGYKGVKPFFLSNKLKIDQRTTQETAGAKGRPRYL